jgi:hypothetical protein
LSRYLWEPEGETPSRYPTTADSEYGTDPQEGPTVDPDARHAHKTVHRRQDGFKAHLAIEPDTGIITDCALTKAGGADNHEAVIGLALLEGEHAPMRVLGDSAYGTGAARAVLEAAGHVAVIKPVPLRSPVPDGFTSDDFAIDFAANTVTCPAAHTLPIRPSGGVAFERYCRSCPLALRCTTAVRGRKLTINIHEQSMRAARALAKDPDWQAEYRQHRPIVERSIAWLTRNNRKLRYRGIAKNDHWLHDRVAALNLRRLITLGLDHTGTNWVIA